MRKIFDFVKEQNLPMAHQRRLVMQSLINGQYLIKVSKKHGYYYRGGSNQYLGPLTFFAGIEFTNRKEAIRFTREELPEVIDQLQQLKRFKLVKLK